MATGGGGNGFTDGKRFGERFDRYKQAGARHGQAKNCRNSDESWGYANWRNMGGEVPKKIIAWDVAPGEDFFKEIFRVSRNQIIWGANYFKMPPTRCFVVWKKLTISETFSMAMAEYAWTSFDQNAKVFECAPQNSDGTRFHPTQKPVKLYEWLIGKYAKTGDKILDPMAGSGACLVACRNTGHDYVGFEIDEEYYKKGQQWIENESAQMNIYDFLNGGNS